MKLAFRAAALATCLVLIGGWPGAWHPALDSLSHFRLHAIAGAASLFVVAIGFRQVRTALALLVVGAASVSLTSPALPGIEPTASGRPDFTIVQQNLLFSNRLPEQAEWEFERSGADVLLLQEASMRSDDILSRLADRYPHRAQCPFRKYRIVAVLSRHPILGKVTCGEDTGLVSARIAFDGRVVTFASLHALWPWPYGQWPQAARAEAELRALPHPLVLAGDFNAAPWSAFAQRIAADSRTSIVPGLRFTFNFQTLQSGDTRMGGLPLDHVLHSDDLLLTDISLMPHVGSDHLGSKAGFRFAR